MYGTGGTRDKGNGTAACFINVNGQKQTGVEKYLDAYILKDFLGNYSM